MADYSTYVKSNQARLKVGLDATDRSRAAWEVARALARRLQEELGATRILLFGSLARGRFGPNSDIDIAFEGVSPKRWYRALRIADAVGEFDVSLFPLDAARGHRRRQIESDAIVLWPE
ncbi:MAG: nucleotidyltransferase family protein [Myxococcales bacterium]